MPRTLLPVLLLLAPTSALAAPSRQECVDAHSQGQDLRDKGKLVEARTAFLQCAQAECPQLVQADCAQFSSELTRLVPSLSFAARTSAGKDLLDTTVYLDEVAVTSRLDDGKVHEVNPGKHTLRFVHAGQEVRQDIVVAQGEKARPIVVTFADPGAAAGSAAPPAAPAPVAAEPPRVGRSGTPLIVAGIGGAFLLGGAALTLYGRSQIPSACSLSSHECQAPPNDPAFEDARKSVSTMNIGFVVGGVGAATVVGGLVWYFMSSPETRQGVAPWTSGRSSAGLSYGLRF